MIQTQKDLTSRIAIIGAGPAGLATAEALWEKGYTNLTIFEKLNRVGGQALSCKYVTADNRTLTYDMGSIQPLSSGKLRSLLDKYGLGYGRGPLEKTKKVFISYSFLKGEEYLNFIKHRLGISAKYTPQVLSDLVKLGRYLWKYRRLRKPGFYKFGYWHETSIPFRKWVEMQEFKVIGDNLMGFLFNTFTLINKRAEDNVKVYTAFKFLYELLKVPPRYIEGTYRPVREGYQELWSRVSQKFNIVLQAKIRSITRDGGVTVNTDRDSYEFDKVFISCPFDRIASVLDVTAEEKEAFTGIEYYPGYRGAFIARNGPVNGIYWDTDCYNSNNEPPYLSLLIPEGKVAENTYLYSCVFSHCPDKTNAVNLLQSSAEKTFREQHNAEITEWLKMQYWHDYSCQFNHDAVKRGVYDKVQEMQGRNNTYYTGQLMSFSANSLVIDYSYELISKFY